MGVANNVLSEPLKLKIINAVGGGEQEWCVLELEAIDAVAKNGKCTALMPSMPLELVLTRDFRHALSTEILLDPAL